MSKRRKSGRYKRQAGQRFYARRITWHWTSRRLLIPQRAWLGEQEHDSYTPPHHYNLHIQPLAGGSDYHNYHIRYLANSEAGHTWSVVDAPYGIELSIRKYTFSSALSIRDIVDVASSVAVADITNDVGDTTLWLPLVECFPLVMLDLYHTVALAC